VVDEPRPFLILLQGPHGVVAAGALRRALPGQEDLVLDLPPVAGLEFFTSSGSQAEQLDQWWATRVGSRRPVVLALEEPGLEAFLDVVDADFVLGISDLPGPAAYTQHQHVKTVVTSDPRVLAETALRFYPAGGLNGNSRIETEPSPSPPVPQAAIAGTPALPDEERGGDRQWGEPGSLSARAARERAYHDPFALLAAVPAVHAPDAPPPVTEMRTRQTQAAPPTQAATPAPVLPPPPPTAGPLPEVSRGDSRPPLPPAPPPPSSEEGGRELPLPPGPAGEVSVSSPEPWAPAPFPDPFPSHTGQPGLFPGPRPDSSHSPDWPPAPPAAGPAEHHPPAPTPTAPEATSYPPNWPPTAPQAPPPGFPYPSGPPPPSSYQPPPPAMPAAPKSRKALLGGQPQGGFSLKNVFGRLPIGSGSRSTVDAQLGQALLSRRPPLCISVVSRKGGVGKTASAAAIAAIFGEAVDQHGATACLVDGNIGNPDAWGRLEIRGIAPTMRDVITRLMNGQDPPTPAYAQTPALAVYPEARDAGDGYAPAQIQRVAGYLRARHAALVVDLPNRLPAFTSAEAAVAAAWIAESDVVLLPATADPAALTSVLEYLAVESLRTKPVVVPYIVPRMKEVRDAPEIRSMLDEVRARIFALVDVPDDDRATLALIRHQAITEISAPLRAAYLRLAETVVHASFAARPASSGPTW
jgi:MinD-like ATPase involved in chromosome partitioning or flagellar assembly